MIALPDFSVAARIACVTGASSGLGAAAAQALAQAGAKVVGVTPGGPSQSPRGRRKPTAT